MKKNQTAEDFAAKIADATSDTAQVRLLVKAEAVLSAEEFARLLTLIKGL